MSTQDSDQRMQDHAMDAADSTRDLTSQPTVHPSTDDQTTVAMEHQINDEISEFANLDHQLGNPTTQLEPQGEQQFDDENIQALANYPANFTDVEPVPVGHEQEQENSKQGHSLGQQEQTTYTPSDLQPVQAHAHEEPAMHESQDHPIIQPSVKNEPEDNDQASQEMDGNETHIATSQPLVDAADAQIQAETSEALRGDPYALAASVSAPSQQLRQDDFVKVEPQAHGDMATAATEVVGSQGAALTGGVEAHDTPGHQELSADGHVPHQWEQDREMDEDSDENMEYTQNDDSGEDDEEEEGDGEDEDEEDHGQMEDFRNQLRGGVDRFKSRFDQQQQQQRVSPQSAMEFEHAARNHYHQDRPEAQQHTGYGVYGMPPGYGMPPAMYHYPVQAYRPDAQSNGSRPLSQEMGVPRQGRQAARQIPRESSGFFQHNGMPLSVGPGMPPQMYPGQHHQLQAPLGTLSMNIGSMGQPFPSNGQRYPTSEERRLLADYLTPVDRIVAPPPMNSRPATKAAVRGPQYGFRLPKAVEKDQGRDDDEPLRTRVARHPSAGDSVIGRSPSQENGAQYDEHDCGGGGIDDDDDFQFISSVKKSKPTETSKPATKAQKAAPKQAPKFKKVPAVKQASTTPAPRSPSAEQQAAEDDSDVTPGATKDDPPVATISIPGLVREDLLLSPDHAEQEAHLLLHVFIPAQQALAAPEQLPAQAVLNFHTIAVMVIEAFVQYEIGDEFGTGRGHWHDEHDRGEEAYVRVRDAKDADPDEIFFAVIDRWRAGLESNKQPSKLIRGAQEFCELALDLVHYVKENGLLRAEVEKKKEKSDKGVKRGAKKVDEAEAEEGKKGTKRAAAKINEVEARKKAKTTPAKEKAKPKPKAKAPAKPRVRASRAKVPAITVMKAKK